MAIVKDIGVAGRPLAMEWTRQRDAPPRACIAQAADGVRGVSGQREKLPGAGADGQGSGAAGSAVVPALLLVAGAAA
ncbi:MAG: hypothetical protein HXX10_26960 [Rhodoplanes sp.]|nr:hypothetical protein [Rhodoplanes sp.]